MRPGPFSLLRWAITDRESLRSWTQTANDGIIATAGLLEGFAGAGATDHTLIIAATTASVVGMISVAGTEWAEAAAQRDGELAAAHEEEGEHLLQPDVELAEVVAYYEGKGLAPQLAREVAEQLMAHDPVDAQLEVEHGILDIMTLPETWRAGVGAGLAYLLGAAIPLIITIVTPGTSTDSVLIYAAAFISLIVMTTIGARTGHMDLRRAIVRTVVVGLATMTLSYLAGRLVF
ncbi:MAG: VIT1/CCC1 transporter family protein [Conexibacteraceae bacterium]|nr:VIT1/CCC1 transporter family protein [Conexibacteraceae bacterium]